MLNLTNKDRPNELEYLNNISVDRRVFFDKQKVIDTMQFEQALSSTDLDLAINALLINCGGIYTEIGSKDKFGGSNDSKMAIMQYLLDEVGEKRRYLLQKYDGRTHESKLSLDANAVLKPLLDMGIATEFLSSYLSYRTHKKAASDMKKKVDSYFVDTQYAGISSLSYQWGRALTGRYYTSNDNIQNISKLYLPCMRGENDDYLLVWGDLDQIDLRVAYYTVMSEDPEDDAIFEKYDDKYEAIARIMDRNLGRVFNYEKFQDNRKKYKKGILARCYGQSLSMLTKEIGDKDFTKMLDDYFKSNNRYSQWYEEVMYNIGRGDDVDIYTYFGNRCHVTLDDLTTSEKKADRILNTPIQSTSNDIIMHIVNNTVREFRKNKIGEDKFRVYMVRHDEPIYMIHKDALDYLPIVRKNTVLQVNDWGPITMSLNIGKYYTEEQYDLYRDYFGDDDVSAGAKIVKRDDVYIPFEPVVIQNNPVINVSGNEVTIGTSKYDINVNEHILYQVHECIFNYMEERGLAAETFKVADGCDVTLRNININSKIVSFVV